MKYNIKIDITNEEVGELENILKNIAEAIIQGYIGWEMNEI